MDDSSRFGFGPCFLPAYESLEVNRDKAAVLESKLSLGAPHITIYNDDLLLLRAGFDMRFVRLALRIGGIP